MDYFIIKFNREGKGIKFTKLQRHIGYLPAITLSHIMLKTAKHTLKFLWCIHRNIF